MSDNEQATALVEGQQEATGGQSGNYTPPATQADLDRIIADRLARERTKYGDYADLKAKAEKFDAAEAERLSDIEKVTKRAEAAEAKVAAYEKREQVATWAKDITKDSPIPADALRGETEAELREHFEQLKSLIPTEAPKKGAAGPYIPAEGHQPTGPVGPAQAFASAFEGRV